MVEKWADEQRMKAEALSGDAPRMPQAQPQTINSLKDIGIGGMM